jgi:hypothetical protein
MAKGVHPLNKENFMEGYEQYLSGSISQGKAAKIAGCSLPTFTKYANMIFLGQELPDNLWGKEV